MTGDDRKPEALVHFSLRFPNIDPEALGQHLTPLVAEGLKLGGKSFNLSIQPYDPDEDEEFGG